MTPAEYEAAGLKKLDPAERAKLDDFIRNYVAASNERVATTAVDKAVKENKVQAPEVIQSRIVGPFTGYNGRSIFTLENGQRWAQSQRDTAYFPKIDSPPVVIVKSGFGYRMHIAGGGAIRVDRWRGRHDGAIRGREKRRRGRRRCGRGGNIDGLRLLAFGQSRRRGIIFLHGGLLIFDLLLQGLHRSGERLNLLAQGFNIRGAGGG